MRMLVAVDGSESSNNALKQVLAFAKQAGGDVIAVTVPTFYGSEAELGLVGTIEEIFTGPAEAILAEARQTAREMGVDIQTVIENGVVHEAIISIAAANSADMIVMGRRGLTAFARALMGSVTARVIGYSPIDVLVIPSDSTLKWGRILVAVDGSMYSDAAVERAIAMSDSYGGKISILTVVDMNPELYAIAPDVADQVEMGAVSIVESAKELADKAGIEAETMVVQGAPHEKILSAAQESGADIICMGSHGRTGLRRLLMGSVTERVIGESKLPVLVVKTR